MRGAQRLLQRALQVGAVGEALAAGRAAATGGEVAACFRPSLGRAAAHASARSFVAATQQAWRAAAARPAAAPFAAAHLHKASALRQFGFAAGGAPRVASRPAAGPTGVRAALRQPTGMAGFSLARQAARRLKATTSELRGANPLETFGPAALTAGLTPGQRRQLAVWLGVCSAWVAVLVVVGGITRLTRSGLSMTSWKFTGERPPSTLEEWEEEFARYKLTPEYIKTNQGMTVDEFKYIYFWEWGHRMWGRALGLVVALPALYFASRGMISRPLGRRLSVLFLMGATQGLVGWWMVRSGFREPETNQVPRVSTYRMAGHLLSAFAIFSGLMWWRRQPHAALRPTLTRPPLSLFTVRRDAAGKDAGRAYNTWPDMNGEWFPSEYFSERLPGEGRARAEACQSCRSAAGVALGITTLLTYVPVPLGAAHQGGAMVLFTLMLGLLYALKPAPSLGTFRRVRHAGLLVAKWGAPATVAAVVGIGGTVVNMT
eukprot:scaffold23.g4133.t1